MTNKEYIFNLDDYELADYLINIEQEYNRFGNDTESYEVYTDPTGNKWYIYDDAIDAIIEWLNAEVE